MQTSSWPSPRHWFATVPILFAALILFATLATPPARAADSYDPNLLANGSFEDGFTDWRIYLRWGFQNVTFHATDTNVIHDGRISARVEATEFPENAGWRQTVAVIPHTRYRLSGWIKTDNVRSGTLGGGANLAVLVPGIDFLVVSDPVTGTTDWTYTELLFDSQDFSTLEIRAGLGAQGRTLGTAWFDDLQLHEVIPRPFISGPADTTATNGLNARLTVGVVSPIPVQFQWLKDGVAIPDATDPVLELGIATPSLSARYSVAVRNAGGVATSRAALLEIVGGARDHPPLLLALETAPLEFIRHPLALTATLELTDEDNSHLTGATVALTRHYSRFEDVLAFANTEAITGAFDDATGVLTLAGRATIAAYQTALRSVKYANARAIRTEGEREIRFTVSPTVVATRALKVRATVRTGVLFSWSQPIPANLGPVVSVARGVDFTIALRTDGTVAAWGDNRRGQTSVPAGLRDVVAIDAGWYHGLALKADGTVVAWGENLHHGFAGQATVPAGLTGVAAIAAGGFHSLALKTDGTVAGWGSNLGNQHFTGSDYDEFFFAEQATPPAGLSGITALAAGALHSLALRADGIPIGWGSWEFDDDFPSPAPGDSAALTGVRGLAGGIQGSAFLLENQTARFWLGFDFSPTDTLNVLAINDQLVLKSDGTVAFWTTLRLHPEPVPMDLATVLELPVHGAGLAIVMPAPPAARPQTVTGREDTDLVITLTGTGPTPADGFSFKITTGPFNGALYQCNNGLRGAPITTPTPTVSDAQRRVIYAPGAQGNGTPFDSFQFAVVDGARMSAPARVTINITAVNDPPIAGFGTSLAVLGSSSAELTRPPFASPTSDFTIELWLRNAVLNDGSYHGILGRHLAGETTNRSPSLWQGPDRGALHLDSLATDGRRFGLLLPGFFQETGAWLHLALVKQGTAYRIYRNGRFFGTGPAPAAVRILADGFSFGRVDNYFRGHLDDIRIWQTARTETEIRAAAGRPLTGKEPALLGAWSCNEGSGKILRDLSPAHNHARLNGNAAFSPLTPPLTWETPRGVTLAGWLPASDFEGDPLRFNTVTVPRSGTLFIDPNGRFTYTPRAGFAGTDTFTYRVNDGRLNSAAATVTVRVAGAPRAPATREFR